MASMTTTTNDSVERLVEEIENQYLRRDLNGLLATLATFKDQCVRDALEAKAVGNMFHLGDGDSGLNTLHTYTS